jgi:hypothetical protein
MKSLKLATPASAIGPMSSMVAGLAFVIAMWKP